MLPFSYLVIGVNPVSNESNVELSKKITITFAKHIDPETLNANTVRLRKVNGELVEYSGRYHNINKSYELTPLVPLDGNTQYQTMILGGVEGVASIDGSYIPTTKTYEFVTVQQGATVEISNLELKQDYLFVAAKWSLPEGMMDGENIHFNVKLSQSNVPTGSDLWPVNSREGITSNTEITIPYKVNASEAYYVHVQGVHEERETAWLTSQIFIEDPSIPAPSVPSEPETPNTGETPTFSQLSVVDHFPQSGELQQPTEIIVLFSEALNPLDFETGVQSPLLYVVEAMPKQPLSLLDLRVAYSVNKAIPGTVSLDAENPNMLIFVPTAGATAFRESKEYTVIVSKDLRGVSGLPLGYTHSFGFTGTPAALYGDLGQIKEMASKFNLDFSTKFLQSLMRKHSQYALATWTESATFDDSLLADGGAPYFMHEYVNTQVAIDALLSGGTSSASASGNESIKLGDLSISKEAGDSSATSLNSMIDMLGRQLKTWTDFLHGYTNRGYAKPLVAIKGESVSPYPDYLTRSELLDFDA